MQHFASPFRWRVKHDTFTEDRRHEGVRLGLIEERFGGTKEPFVLLRPSHHHHIAPADLEAPDVATFLADTSHQADWISAHLIEVVTVGVAPAHQGD